ncbi:MAG: AAA-like domain-containing protein [Cyanobacteria bacterium P01_F01_bin.150]
MEPRCYQEISKLGALIRIRAPPTHGQNLPAVSPYGPCQSMPEGTRLDPIQSYKLESMGLITIAGNTARIGCSLYEKYFSETA